jgi:adenosylcobinamide-GDP ribazoletransferase
MPSGLSSGLRLALTTFTVAPLRPGRVDRAAATVAMCAAPLVGALLGLVLAGARAGLAALGSPGLLTGVLTVGLGALLTRGLHLDGLADTADGLGSYADRERTLAIMKRPDIGAFGVVALVLVLLAQAASLATGPSVAAVVTAVATGRLAIGWACRRGVPAARPEGLGSLVAGTVGAVPLALATVALLALALAAVPHRPWQGPVAVMLALAVALLLVRHAVRRLGGITGDVLGAACEASVTVAFVLLVLR